MKKLLLTVCFALMLFLFIPEKPVAAQDCSCGSCSVGFVCDHCPLRDSYGPATWRCLPNGCCRRPGEDDCGAGSGAEACLANGYRITNRIHCAQSASDCVAAPTQPPSTPTPTLPPQITPPDEPVPPGNQPDPIPPPYVECDDTASPEFHSLRPYQASPCNQNLEDIALYCGTDLVLTDSFTITKTYISSSYTYEGQTIVPVPMSTPVYPVSCFYCNEAGQCVSRENDYPDCIYVLDCEPGQECATGCTLSDDYRTETCNFNVDRSKSIAVDLSGAYLPIMGNTERVINSQNQEPESPPGRFDDPIKVNEYVSWYLNGVIGRAEYPPPDPETDEGRGKIVDYSGPLKKLLSQENQAIIRDNEAQRAGVDRHDQIIGCLDSSTYLPAPCYPSGSGTTQVRLSQTRDNPFPRLRDYDNFFTYLAALNEWRRRFAENLLSHQLASYVPFSSTEDRMGEVEIVSHRMQPSSYANFRILSSVIKDQSPAELFFSHMQETSEMARILQQTFVPYGGAIDEEAMETTPVLNPYCDLVTVRSNPGDNLFAGEITATLEYTAQVTCNFLVPGDGITPWGNLCENLAGGTCYTFENSLFSCETNYGRYDCAPNSVCGVGCSTFPTDPNCTDYAYQEFPLLPWQDFTCIPNSWSCAYTVPEDVYGPTCGSGHKCGLSCLNTDPVTAPPNTQQCPNSVYVSMRTVTKTPLADDVWARLVAGPAGVFRRFAPKIEATASAAIQRLWDIPGATGVRIISPDGSVVAGNLDSRRGSQAELYFPHIGGIHEYFLKCLQKSLRPDGYGEGCVSAPLSSRASGDCTPGIPDLPDIKGECEYGNCWLEFPSLLMQEIFESAASFYNVPTAVLAGIFYSEGGFNRPLYDWASDEFIMQVSGPGCEVPQCDDYNVSSAGAKGPWQFIPSTWAAYGDAVLDAIDDGREPNVCNLVDSTFAAAKKLARESGGAASYYCAECANNILLTGQGTVDSCSLWGSQRVVTAARQYLGYCEQQPPLCIESPYSPSPSCIADADACYQRRVLNIYNLCN
jgi:hypothetical protein